MTLPIGFSPAKNCRTNVSFTIAAPGNVSFARKSLPSIIRIFIVSAQPGDTFRKKARMGPGGAPFTETNPFHPPPPSSAQPATATVSTPGTVRKCSAT